MRRILLKVLCGFCAIFCITLNVSAVDSAWVSSVQKVSSTFDREIGKCYGTYTSGDCGSLIKTRYDALLRIAKDETIDPRLRLCLLQNIARMTERGGSDGLSPSGALGIEFYCSSYPAKSVSVNDSVFRLMDIPKFERGTVMKDCQCYSLDYPLDRQVKERYCRNGSVYLKECPNSKFACGNEIYASYECN